MKGERLSVKLNGEEVIQNAQLPAVPKEGPIALQHHDYRPDFALVVAIGAGLQSSACHQSMRA